MAPPELLEAASLSDPAWPEMSNWDEIEPPDWAYDDYDGDDPFDEQREPDPDDHERLALRGDGGQTSRSRNNMRRQFASLPWEMLGARPAMLSLTYPGDWLPWVPDGRVWEAHRRAFGERWKRRWNEPLVGVWAKEFQKSGRPHLHLYIGLPSGMADDDFAGLRTRTLLRHRLQWTYGTYDGRKRLPAIGGQYGGNFGLWARTAWSEVVGTQGVVQAHRARGVDVAVMFWTDEVAARADRTRVAAYLANEASKWRQKQPPVGFLNVGRYYGLWGRKLGFKPVTEEVGLDLFVAWEVERRLVRWVNWKMHVRRGGMPAGAGGLALRRPGDGITAFGLGSEDAKRLVVRAEAAVVRKQSQPGDLRGSGGEAPGKITNSERHAEIQERASGGKPAGRPPEALGQSVSRDLG